MTASDLSTNRIATLAYLASAVPGQQMGRTAAMKLVYFLQELHEVPLGYTFGLYTYGPFQSEVLDDLGTARLLGAITEKTVLNRVGYRYEISPGPDAGKVQAKAAGWLERNRSVLDAVVKEFGSRSASDLELGSTVVFVDRELHAQQGAATVEAVANRVHEIKPHFAESAVLTKVKEFLSKGLLKCSYS